MDSTNLCSVCQNYGHRVSKCPELGPNAPPPSGGGGGSHSHDDDERATLTMPVTKVLNLFTAQNN
jgi:hypothetical protein